MEERKYRKLTEAQYFLGQMVASEARREEFMYNLSAFASAARSVMQYAHRDTQADAAAKRWYDTQCQSFPSLKFFKDKRDLNVHTEPLTASLAVTQHFADTVHVSDSLSWTLKDQAGHVIRAGQAPPAPKPAPPTDPPLPPEFRYYFADWPLKEDVVSLCTKYLDDIVAMIEDGEQKGLLRA
jgi:hypothetical protein